jgi:hypothetical protein
VVRTIAILTFAVILALAVWTWIALSFAYAHGERAGYIQTLSKQGWIFKTWEGELAMVNLPGAMPEIFRFSVRDDAIAAQLQGALGHRVRIFYEEHVGVPVNWFAESQYYVIRAEIIPGEPPPR